MNSVQTLLCCMGVALMLLFATPSSANNYIAGADYASGDVYALCFDDNNVTATRSTWTADGGSKPVSLAFYAGADQELGKEQLQLFVADNSGRIWRLLWGEAYTVGEEPQKSCNDIQLSSRYMLYTRGFRFGFGPDNPQGLSINSQQQLIALHTGSFFAAPAIWRFDLSNFSAQQPVRPYPKKVIANLPFTSLKESLVLPESMADESLQGDLLVITEGPNTIIKLDSSCLTSSSGICGGYEDFIGGTAANPLASAPVGMALLPSPYQNLLLVSQQNGSVALFDVNSGSPVLVDPALVTGLGQGPFKIKTTRKSAVLDNNGSNLVQFSAHLYAIGNDQSSVQQITLDVVNGVVSVSGAPLLSVDSGVGTPQGLATTTDDFIRITPCTTNCGDDVTVNITDVIEHQFDTSVATGEPVAGYIGETYEIIRDPRSGCIGNASATEPGPLYIWKNQAYLSDPSTDGSSIVIPSHLCGSPANDPHLVIVKTVSDVDPTKTQLSHRVYDTDLDGNGSPDLQCITSDLTQLPAVGWTPIPNSGEDEIVEGNQVIDMISGCGSLRLKTRTLSYFVVGLRNQPVGNDLSLQFKQLISAEYDNLVATLNEANSAPNCVANQGQLYETFLAIDRITDAIAADDHVTLQSDSLYLLTALRDNEQNLMIAPKNQGCPKNFIGDVQSRAAHLYFSTATKLLQQTWVDGCSEQSAIEQCLQ